MVSSTAVDIVTTRVVVRFRPTLTTGCSTVEKPSSSATMLYEPGSRPMKR
jgi:hypothetical protein